MSQPIRRGGIVGTGARNRTFTTAALLVMGLAAVAALLSTGAEARSAAVPSNTSPPTITGTAVVGETLTAVPGSWTGTPPISLARAWQRCDAAGANCSVIAAATGTAYVVTATDIGSTLRVRETATNAEGSLDAPSAPTAVVTAQTAPVNTAEPLISGSAVEGATISTSTGTWTGTSLMFTYQWVRCDAGGGLSDGSDCPSIPSATSSSYTLVAADIGRRLRVQVTASNATGTASATANPTDVVQQATTSGPPRNLVEPSISGTFVVGRVLFASLGTWAGTTPITYEYQWVRCGGDGGLPDGSNCTFISGATTSSYTLTTDDVGQRMRIRITATNSLGKQTLASNASDVVTATSSTTPAPQAPRVSVLPAILGPATVGTTLTASVGLWTGAAPILYSYQWVRCGADGGQSTGAGCPAIPGATGTQYTLATVDLGQRLRVQVTARNAQGTSTATSSATTQVQAAGSTPPASPPPTGGLPPGAIRLANGKYSIPVTSVSPPERLIAEQAVFAPNPVRSRERPIELRVRVLDTRGYVVRDALVFARSTPLLTSGPGEQPSGRDGWVRLRMTPRADFPLGAGRNVQFFVRVRKPTDELLAGVSNRRLVQVATAGPG
jgi:hypothetical protein